MFARELSFEDRKGQLTVKDPDWEQIEKAIRNLDGKVSTLVTLATDGETHMSIGGGNDGQYVAYITFDNQLFNSLANSSNSDDQVSVVAGGQEGKYAAKKVVGLADVLKAAKTFAETGELDQSLQWMK